MNPRFALLKIEPLVKYILSQKPRPEITAAVGRILELINASIENKVDRDEADLDPEHW